MLRGDVVPVRFEKWGGRPHWELDMRYLGTDEFGGWVGSPAGMPMRRPGAQAWTSTESALLVPAVGDFVALFYGPANDVAVYVDVTDRPRWDDGTVRAVDLDLDVILMPDGTVVVDDEDEFADHQVALGYPLDVVRAAEASCAELVRAMRAGEEPWTATGPRWCAEAAGLTLAPLPPWATALSSAER